MNDRPTNAPRRRSTLVPAAIATLALAAGAVYLTLWSAAPVSTAHALQPGDEGVTEERLARVLTQVGLTPEALAATGADEENVSNVVIAMRAWILSDGITLEDAEEDLAIARADHESLERAVRRGQRDQATLDDLADAFTALTQAESDRAFALQGAFDLAANSLTSAQRTTIARIHDNRVAYPNMPAHFAATTWTDASWLALRNATCHADQMGEDCEAGAETILADALDIAAVSDAQSNLDDLAACTSAWEAAVESNGT